MSAARMLCADLNASAMMVSVGFAVATVGKLPLPTIQRLGTSWERWLASTTDRDRPAGNCRHGPS